MSQELGGEMSRMQTTDSSALIATPRHSGASCPRPHLRRSHIGLMLGHRRVSIGPQPIFRRIFKVHLGRGCSVLTVTPVLRLLEGAVRPKDINRCQCCLASTVDSGPFRCINGLLTDDVFNFLAAMSGDGKLPPCSGVHRRSHANSNAS